ncbi:MAG: PD-(D/E)XK nuclease family protein [Halorientalis sp.]
MSLTRTRPIDRLYAEVEGYDLVLVPDAPLASALNRRLDRPHFGPFATTPRRLAAGRREQAEDRLAFLSVIQSTALDWKTAAHVVGNVLQCWEHQGQLDAILDYDGYDDPATTEVVETLADLRTTSSRLTEYSVDPDQNLAVVGEAELTTLERSILPADYAAIDPFVDEPFDLPAFQVFDSSAAIIDALLDAIDAEAAEQVAVVVDESSQYSSLVKAALTSADIPFYGGPGFVDDPDHRAFVQLLRASQAGRETTVGDVRPVLTRLDLDVPIDYDKQRLRETPADAIQWLVSFADALSTRTFAEALDTYEGKIGATLQSFREELDALGLADQRVTPARVDDLVFYLQAYEVPVDRDNEGVLLADAKAAAHVDRPTVFYLGLDESWTHSAPHRPWVARDEQFERSISQFQRLLQNGVERYYLVQDTAGGDPVTPCLYFHELLDEPVERFTDLESVDHTRTFDGGSDGFETEPVAVDSEPVDLLSQSTLNALVNCPRDHLFGRLVGAPDEDYFTEGTLFHDFAEVYATHPEAVGESEREAVVSYMRSEVRPYYAETDADLRETKYRAGLETIAAYLDVNPPASGAFLTPTSAWGTNEVADLLDLAVESPVTERWFENDALGIKGMIDLVAAPTHLLDYKSGYQKSARDVVEQAAIDPPADTVNYQALLYLAHWRTGQPDDRLEFTFFHFLDALDEVVTGDASIDDMLTTVTYYPSTFDEFVTSREAYEVLLDGYNDCVETFADLGFAAYHDIVSQDEFPDTTDKAELRASAFADSFESAVETATSDAVSDPEKGCDQAIRALNGVRKRAFFRDDIDAFEGFAQSQREQLNEYRRGVERFPMEGPGGEPNYRRVDHRDMLLEGDDA